MPGCSRDDALARGLKMLGRVGLMDQGRIVEDCPKADFFGKLDARTPRAREFLSKIPAHWAWRKGAMGQSAPCPKRWP